MKIPGPELTSVRYDPETGDFYWVSPVGDKVKPGQLAGCINKIGYIVIRIHKKLYLAHRLAWLHYYGEWSNQYIDHINGIRSDNRLCNLREASKSQNGMNRGKPSNNSSGVKGVYWSNKDKRWVAEIKTPEGKKLMKYFKRLEDAESARKKLEILFFGEFAYVQD